MKVELNLKGNNGIQIIYGSLLLLFLWGPLGARPIALSERGPTVSAIQSTEVGNSWFLYRWSRYLRGSRDRPVGSTEATSHDCPLHDGKPMEPRGFAD